MVGSTRLRLLVKARPAMAGSPHTARVPRSALPARADELAVQLSAAPATVLAVLLAANVALASAGIAIGAALVDDPAVYFRELAPGTWMSAGHMLAAAVAAQAIHRRQPGPPLRRHQTFWGMSAVLLAVLAVVELTQPTVFLGKWLQGDLGLRAPSAVSDIDALLVVGLLVVVAAVVLPRARVLLDHPKALGLLAVGALIGAASQTLDTLWPVSTWEFVVEDGLKALAEPFVVAGFLVALAAHTRSRPPTVSGA